jgi:RNA polymerase sigma-70 factor (ECF subfamily)
MLAAWRSLGSFDRRSSLRTWLYRIATNRCLNALRDAARRPPVAGPAPFPIPEPTRNTDVHWLEPFPEDRLAWLASAEPGPAARYEAREAVEITFVAALQRLTGKQRAVLVLRDVLGFHAQETAAMLDTTVESVKSALKRARATLETELPERLAAPTPNSPEEQALLSRFVEAFLADDVERIVALVTEHAWFRMPPATLEYQGPAPIASFLSALNSWRAEQAPRVIPTRANGQPAFGVYRVGALDGGVTPIGLLLLSLRGERIGALTWFVGPGYLEQAGLPLDPSSRPPVSELR